MSSMFFNLCNQIAIASASTSSLDSPSKSLGNFLNEMTRYVAMSRTDNDDELIVYGWVSNKFQMNRLKTVFLFELVYRFCY